MSVPTTGAVADRGDRLRERIQAVAAEGPEAVERRLGELAREWTAGRMVKATTGLLLVAGLALTSFANPWWLLLVVIAGAVLLQYWFFPRSWLAAVFERVGFRPGSVIDDERLALRVLRGDFRHLPTLRQIEDRDAVTRMEGEGGPAVEPEEEKLDPKEAAELIVPKVR